MTRLTAIYKIQLDNPLVIKRRDDDCPTFRTIIDGFEVIISLTDQFMAGIRFSLCVALESRVSAVTSGNLFWRASLSSVRLLFLWLKKLRHQ